MARMMANTTNGLNEIGNIRFIRLHSGDSKCFLGKDKGDVALFLA